MGIIDTLTQESLESPEDMTLAIELMLRDLCRHVGRVERQDGFCSLVFETQSHGFVIRVFDEDEVAMERDAQGLWPRRQQKPLAVEPASDDGSADADDDESPPGPFAA